METDHLSHIDDPWTSNHAAVTLDKREHHLLLHAVVTMLSDRPMTDSEMRHVYQARAEREGWPLVRDIFNVTKRRSELARKFNVVEADETPGVSDLGKPAKRWRLKFAPDMCHIIVGMPLKKDAA